MMSLEDADELIHCNPQCALTFHFLNTFGALLDIQLGFEEFEDMIRPVDNGGPSERMINFQAYLIQPLMSVAMDKPTVAIASFMFIRSKLKKVYTYHDYRFLPFDLRIELLLETFELALKTIECSAKYSDAKWQRLGKDYNKVEYYYQVDMHNYMRIYTLHGKNMKRTWSLKVKSVQSLYNLICYLKKQKLISEDTPLDKLPSLPVRNLDEQVERLFMRCSYVKLITNPESAILTQIRVKRKKKQEDAKEFGKTVKFKDLPYGAGSRIGINENIISRKRKHESEVERNHKRRRLESNQSPKSSEGSENKSEEHDEMPQEIIEICAKCHEKGEEPLIRPCTSCSDLYHVTCAKRSLKKSKWKCRKCANKHLVKRLTIIYNKHLELEREREINNLLSNPEYRFGQRIAPEGPPEAKKGLVGDYVWNHSFDVPEPYWFRKHRMIRERQTEGICSPRWKQVDKVEDPFQTEFFDESEQVFDEQVEEEADAEDSENSFDEAEDISEEQESEEELCYGLEESNSDREIDERNSDYELEESELFSEDYDDEWFRRYRERYYRIVPDNDLEDEPVEYTADSDGRPYTKFIFKRDGTTLCYDAGVYYRFDKGTKLYFGRRNYEESDGDSDELSSEEEGNLDEKEDYKSTEHHMEVDLEGNDGDKRIENEADSEGKENEKPKEHH
ncbi:unnamed protein product [Bursaphelenchus okinawaensis]|uniref:Zinc finger PHD-type domain-containing protein n=1 Tax=Bursaphelenchus okinawaensis TaxID=465554 RepID=A0A811L3H9_9BILA|nr:unnamed protein product [Bursaphelenchus okinawaensis]CAG9118419.1 unnamed protein product [Bursaphelenchus okinawaensis]